MNSGEQSPSFNHQSRSLRLLPRTVCLGDLSYLLPKSWVMEELDSDNESTTTSLPLVCLTKLGFDGQGDRVAQVKYSRYGRVLAKGDSIWQSESQAAVTSYYKPNMQGQISVRGCLGCSPDRSPVKTTNIGPRKIGQLSLNAPSPAPQPLPVSSSALHASTTPHPAAARDTSTGLFIAGEARWRWYDSIAGRGTRPALRPQESTSDPLGHTHQLASSCFCCSDRRPWSVESWSRGARKPGWWGAATLLCC